MDSSLSLGTSKEIVIGGQRYMVEKKKIRQSQAFIAAVAAQFPGAPGASFDMGTPEGRAFITTQLTQAPEKVAAILAAATGLKDEVFMDAYPDEVMVAVETVLELNNFDFIAEKLKNILGRFLVVIPRR